MEIIVLPEITYVLISHTDDSYRRIYTDGREFPSDAALTYAGYSIGHWVDEDGDGKYDVLEVFSRFPAGYRASRSAATIRPSSNINLDKAPRQHAL
jgi:hypothetical protein